ncbi:hypothetical protein COY95_03460 [Candidatus Woesearchaeota archaeon CG_4_10_14_0_8_um_filter_47_5]|nr:MAG: hypothetical protein COY95_03460 [Candidatus Woesearchaeota archaeon CG_4_10_14_0_8_um_filter_47_5]
MVQKRKFTEIRELLLFSLARGQQTINSLSKSAGVNWKTTENHLIHLIGMGWVREVLHIPYVRIYELTDMGQEKVRKLQQRQPHISVDVDKLGIPNPNGA